MSGVASKAASAAGKVASAASKAAKPESKSSTILKREASKNPELYILGAIMAGAFGLAGWQFGRKPTSASSEAEVGMAEGSMPWQTDGSQLGKYKYHPGGDPTKPPKEAPSALHSVIVPNVNLPKSLHDQFNKWGKDEY